MNLKPGHRLAYQISAETYWADHSDDPRIYVQSTREGEPDWEITIDGTDDLGTDNLKVTVFDDAFAAFTEAPEVFRALQVIKETVPLTLVNVRAMLDGLGAVDITERVFNAPRKLARVSDTPLG